MHIDPSVFSNHQQADLKEDVKPKEVRQQSTPSSDRRVVQQRVDSYEQNPQPTPFVQTQKTHSTQEPSSGDRRVVQHRLDSDQQNHQPLCVQHSGYPETLKTQPTQKPLSADQRTVVDQFKYNNRNPQAISKFATVDEKLVPQISGDTKSVDNVEQPLSVNQKNIIGGVEILKNRSPGETSTATRNTSYSTKWTPREKKKYHYSRPPVGREEWRWSSPSTAYPHVSTKSSTNAEGIQCCYQSTPKSYGDPHNVGVEYPKHVGNISASKKYGCSNPELDDLELSDFNLYASPEDIRLVQGTLELLSTINDMGYVNEVAT